MKSQSVRTGQRIALPSERGCLLSNRSRLLPILVGFVLTATLSAIAQGGRANINGTVSDEAGAVVAGAQVSARNVSTGQTTAVVTSSGGTYSLPFLPIGRYEISATQNGFNTETQTDITLTADQVATVNFSLKLGKVTTKVEVMASGTQLETSTGELSQTIDQKAIQELPLNGRNPAALVFTVPGAVDGEAVGLPQSGSAFQSGQQTQASVNGSRNGGVYYMLDGFNNIDENYRNADPFPNSDATQEFTVITNNFDAQYGFTAGAIVSIATKSGTNQWHGEGFEFLRNNSLNAKDYFTGIANPLKRNQFGGSIGGPIVRDKLFIFGNYQQTNEHISIASSGTSVPSNAELNNGDFSALCTAGFSAGLCNDSTEQLYMPGGAHVDSNAYLNNQIPVSSYSPVSLKIETLLPHTDDPAGNVLLLGKNEINDGKEFTIHSDYYLTSKQHISAHWFLDDFTNPAFSGNGDILNESRAALGEVNNVGVDYTFSIRPNLVNDFRFGYNRIQSTFHSGLVGSDGKPLGPEALGQNLATPDQTIGYLVTNHFGISDVPVFLRQHHYLVSDTVSLNKGNHLIVAGVDVQTQYQLAYDGWGSDSFEIFNGGVTGNDFADFLLGDMVAFEQSGGEYNGLHGNNFAFFGQDSIKLKPNLTINTGVRWEPQSAPHYTNNTLPFWSPGQTSTRFPNAPENLVYAGDTGVPIGGWKTDWGAVEPRLSLAWAPHALPNTSIRVAGAEMVQPYPFAAYNHMGTTAPFAPSYEFNYNSPTISPGCILNISSPWACYAPTGGTEPFPPFSGANFHPGTNSTFVLPTSIGAAFTPGYRLPRDYTWNMSIEHMFRDYLFTVAYVGRADARLYTVEDLNPTLFNASTYATDIANNISPSFPNQWGNFSSVTGYVSQGHASYNALQISVNKRFSRGLQFTSNFTWSKNIDDFSGNTGLDGNVSDPFDLEHDRGISNLNLPRIWNNTLVYESPGFPAAGKVGDAILGHWEISGIWSLHSGMPINVYGGEGNNNSFSGVGLDRADIVPGVSLDEHRGSKSQWLQQYFNPAAFVTNAIGSFGNSRRNILTGPGYNNVDVSFAKNFPIRERYRIQFRWEMFNAFNRTWFGNPDTTVGDPNIGRILSDNTNNQTIGPRLMQAALKFYF